MDETYDPLAWLRGGCRHEWRTGPMADLLMRHRPALCIKCWTLVERMPFEESQRWPEWTNEDYEQHKDEVERRFFGTTPLPQPSGVKVYG